MNHCRGKGGGFSFQRAKKLAGCMNWSRLQILVEVAVVRGVGGGRLLKLKKASSCASLGWSTSAL